jgi:hypothetical protein
MSTIKSINLVHPTSATNNIVLDSTGNATVGGTMAMSSSFMRNRIINGNFDIWQRGTSFSSSGVNEYSVDRFRTEGFNLSSTISRQSFTSNQTDVPYYPTYYCRVATSATVSGGQYWAFQQRIEAPQNLSGYETVTLSFYARASSGTVAANTFSYGGSSGRANNPTLTTSWQRLTHTWTGSGPASGYVEIYLMYLGAGVAATSVDFANVQLEVGTVATPFEREIYSETLAKCQRYYYRMKAATNYANFGIGRAYNGTGAGVNIELPVPMRAAPSGSTSGYANFNSSGTSATVTNLDPVNQYDTNYRRMTINVVSSFTTGQAVALNAENTTAAEMSWSAEL